MSVIFSYQNNILLCHQTYVDAIYEQHSDLNNSGQATRSCNTVIKIKNGIFDLNIPFSSAKSANINVIENAKQRKIAKKKTEIQRNANAELQELIQHISEKTSAFLKLCQEREFLKHPIKNTIPSNQLAENFLDFFRTDSSFSIAHGRLHGQNPDSNSIITKIGDVDCVIPPKCAFYNRDIRDLEGIAFAQSYDLIVLDPPWWNKYIRRSRGFVKTYSYEMLTNDHIKNLPLENLTTPNVTLVGIWCTNSPTLIQLVIDELLPKWNLKLVATWYWVKITKYGDTICNFNLPLQKQPFEQLFIACHSDSELSTFSYIENKTIIYSIPSIIHSHKPPISELLLRNPENPQCLELFARYLQPNFTSIGLEVLKLQNLNLFDIS